MLDLLDFIREMQFEKGLYKVPGLIQSRTVLIYSTYDEIEFGVEQDMSLLLHKLINFKLRHEYDKQI